jgi:hypothetical protein
LPLPPVRVLEHACGVSWAGRWIAGKTTQPLAARDADGNELFESNEASWPITLIRRFADLGPDWLAQLQLLPFSFVVKRDGRTGRDVQARARQAPRPLRPGAGEGLRSADQRLVFAFALALDALQDR